MHRALLTDGEESMHQHDEACCQAHPQPGEGHAHSCSDHVHEGDAHACEADGGACSCAEMFAFPSTDERVTIPANDLAFLLDMIEELVQDPARLGEEFLARSRDALAEQAPRLVALREDLLNRIRGVLAERAPGLA